MRNTVRIPCFDTASPIAPQNVVVVAVKGPALPSIAAALPGLLKPDGLLVFAMNGIPWWFDQGMPVQLPDWLRALIDPDRLLERTLAPVTRPGSPATSATRFGPKRCWRPAPARSLH